MATAPAMRLPCLRFSSFRPMERVATALPPGVCARFRGIALVYNVLDDFRTLFKPGCLDRTKREKVPTGRVHVFLDHLGRTGAHAGVARTLTTEGMNEILDADLFDTEVGRSAKEYLDAVLAAGGYTGLSIGFFERTGREVVEDGQWRYEYEEVELDEISLTPRPAVPGADVLAVRALPVAVQHTVIRELLAALPDDAALSLLRERSGAPTPPAPEEGTPLAVATMDARIAACRTTYAAPAA